MADLLKSMNEDNGISMNSSLGGNNILQSGNDVVEYSINYDGGVAIAGWDLNLPFFDVLRDDVNTLVNKQHTDIFKDSYTGTLKRSIESNEVFNAAVENIAPFSTAFNADRFSQDLQMVARSIAARDNLGAKRQIFFVNIGGFDNHDELINNHGALMQQLDAGLGSFSGAMDELNTADCITCFTISHFARTLTSNGNGTDHAWGGNAMVLGGAVKGKEMYGTYPSLAIGSDLELGKGVFIPSTSADLYFAELALWFGISPSEL